MVCDPALWLSDDEDTLAIPCEIADAIAVSPLKGDIDGDSGPVILNTKENWAHLRASALVIKVTAAA